MNRNLNGFLKQLHDEVERISGPHEFGTINSKIPHFQPSGKKQKLKNVNQVINQVGKFPVAIMLQLSPKLMFMKQFFYYYTHFCRNLRLSGKKKTKKKLKLLSQLNNTCDCN